MGTTMLPRLHLPNQIQKTLLLKMTKSSSAAPILSATTSENLVGVSVLAGEELQRRMSGSLGETLKFEPGISSSFFGAGASRPIIRGQGGLRVLLLDNGIGSIDASSASPDHAAAVEPAMASRIEVIRGSGLLRFGSAASGGVINVIDGRIPDRVPNKSAKRKARIGLSSVDNGYETAMGSDIALGKTSAGDIVGHIEMAYRKTENYDIPNFARSKDLRQIAPLPLSVEVKDTLPNSATKATSLAAGLSFIGETMFLGGAVKDLNSEYGIPGGEGSTIRLDQTRYDFTSKYDFGAGFFENINLLGGAANYEHKEIEANGDIGTVFTNKGFELRSEITQRERGAWHAAHGVQYKRREFSAIGEEAFVPPTVTKMLGLFSFHELDFDALHLEAAARFETVKHKNDTGTSLTFNGVSGSFGVDYHLTDKMKLGGTLYRTERAPTTEELFSNGPHLATSQFEIGDRDLGKEIAAGIEISLRYKDGGDHMTFNLFYTDYSDYIYERITGDVIISDEVDALTVSQFTPADAVFKGFEIDLAKDWGQWRDWDISTDASLEYVDARIDITGQNALPRIPPLGLTLGVSADADIWTLRAELEYANKKTKLAFGERPSDSYALLNAFVSREMNDNTKLRFSALNLTNQDARQHTSFLKELVPLPGRNFKISLEVKF